MKKLVSLGVAALTFAVVPNLHAQSSFRDSFLSRGTYTASRMQPSLPEVDPSTLPAPGPRPTAPTTDYTSSSAYGAYGAGYADAGCYDGSCATGTCNTDGGYTTLGHAAGLGLTNALGTAHAHLASLGGCQWYGGLYALAMTRDDDFDTYLSYDASDPSMPLMSTSDASFDYGAGFGVTIGRYINQCWGAQAVYWSMFPGDEEYTIYNADYPGMLSGAIGYDGLLYNNGTMTDSAVTYYGTPTRAAQAHRIRRSFEAHNFEFNFVRNPYRAACDVHIEMLMGFRYLRMDDGLVFSSAYNSPMFGAMPNDELHHVIDVENHLVGFQLGGRATRYFGCKWGAFAGTKFGVYNNHVRHEQRLYGGNGNAYVGATNEDYMFDYDDDDIAFIGELDLGLSYCLTQRWKLTGGYRAVAVSGVALATSQFPRDREFANIVRSSNVDTEDSIILHGAYLGAEFNW